MTPYTIPAMAWVPLWLVLWLPLAGLWLWHLPRQKVRWIDRVYPVIPLAAATLFMSAGWRWPPALAQAFVQWLALGVWFWLMLTLVWLLSVLKRDSSIMDLAYGFLLLGAPWWLWSQASVALGGGQALLLALVSLGFGRYALYVSWRNLPHGEDPRYGRWRERVGPRWWWWSYFQVFLLQGVVIWIWSLPLVLAMRPEASWSLWHLIGVLVWAVGLVFEAGGDWQLARFKRQREHPQQLLDTGLWALSRHPNYFGQTCMWWGYGLIALAHPWGWLALPTAAYVTWFMHRGSATSLMERHMMKTKPGYAQYCERVPAFFPRIGRASPANTEQQP
jgi:steroid 5-alpha reductase family enzyme